MPRKRKSTIEIKFGGGRRGRKSRLSSASVADLQGELRRREAMLEGLLSQRQELSNQLQQIDSWIAAQGGTIPGAGEGQALGRRRRGRPRGTGRARSVATPRHGNRRGRARGGVSLADALHTALTGTQMSVGDVATAVKKAGYQSSSPNFRTIVNAALLANPGRFRKVERGVYTAK